LTVSGPPTSAEHIALQAGKQAGKSGGLKKKAYDPNTSANVTHFSCQHVPAANVAFAAHRLELLFHVLEIRLGFCAPFLVSLNRQFQLPYLMLQAVYLLADVTERTHVILLTTSIDAMV